jgi:small subunit ribosomal protein S17
MNAPNSSRGRRKENIGTVISNKMDKTVVVTVSRKMRHAKYGKVVERTKKYYAHDDSDAVTVGQTVRIAETRPLSKLKRWRVVEVL